MYQNKDISFAQYQMLHERVKQVGGEDLSKYGAPGESDITTYSNAVNGGMTPTQAVQHTVTTHTTNSTKAGTPATLSQQNYDTWTAPGTTPAPAETTATPKSKLDPALETIKS